jgi:hypothetical protein
MATKRTTGKVAAAPRAPKPARAARKARKAASPIRSWQDDPGAPGSGNQPVESEVPNLTRGRLPIAITDPAPPAGLYESGTPEFRYWVAAEALGRSAAMWAALLPQGFVWVRTNGRRLPIGLDEGEDLNAYYDRRGLHFFHAPVAGQVVFSGESPDICSHELGHAVLDGLRPALWGASFIEAGAFHESFADISSLLTGLHLPSLREAVLAETSSRLNRTSRLSRVAEQLGWAIRQLRPDAVAPDSLRNAVNSFFYQDPSTLPPMAPASSLSSEPHSFSRVFTAAFLEGLAAMHALQPAPDQAGLVQASMDAGQLLVDAVVSSPLVPAYFSQVAAHMVEADAERFEGRYGRALTSGFVRHGVLSLESANAVLRAPRGGPRVHAQALVGPKGSSNEPMVPLPGQRYGLNEYLLVPALAETKRFSVRSSGPDLRSVDPPSHDSAARSFVEDLFRRQKVELPGLTAPQQAAHQSHAVRREAEGLVLVRTSVDCGFDLHR